MSHLSHLSHRKNNNKGKRMITTKQLQANRQNAQRSTGPKSLEGKEVVSTNALKHGILSKKLLIRDESSEDFDSLKESMYTDLQPIGATEELLVEKIVITIWRLKRLIHAECSALSEKSWNDQYNDPHKCFYGKLMNTISRYEATLEKSLYRAIHELQRIRGLRTGESVTAPIAIEMNV